MTPIKILYIEDEISLAKIVKETLEVRGFEVHHESSGQKAYPAYQEFQPDLCVLDVMLPVKDGFEIGNEIRHTDPGIPIIYLTAKSQTADMLEGFKAGGNDYIRKPFSLEELIVRINNLIHLTKNISNTKKEDEFLKIGFFTLDYKRQLLTYEDKERKLSHKEANLLRMLAVQKNKVVERKTILQQLWGDDSFFNSRNLDVYITKLRGYLKSDTSVELITLKGVGYRLVD